MRESQASSLWQLFQYCRYFGHARIEIIDCFLLLHVIYVGRGDHLWTIHVTKSDNPNSVYERKKMLITHHLDEDTTNEL